MLLRTVLLMLLLLVTYDGVTSLEIICQVQLQLPMEPAMAEKLSSCGMYIVSSVSFDINKSTVLTSEELTLIDVLKKSNSSADILLTIVLPFNVTIEAGHRALGERISIVLRDNVLDGVDLDLDVALLDHYEQFRYGQFLRQLRKVLGDKYAISTTLGCHSLGSSKVLLSAFNDHLDLVSVVGVDNDLVTGGSVDSVDEFTPRQYSTVLVNRLIQDGLRAEKIVLSVLTVGVVFNPASHRITRSLHRSHIGVLSYGQVCELLQDQTAKCSSEKHATCSLFGGKAAIVYDNEQTARNRTLQAHQLGVRGVLILPNYDDSENLCKAGSFPLFRSVLETVASRHEVAITKALVCDANHRYGDVDDPGLYYTYANGRVQRHRCDAGKDFNEELQICMSSDVPPIVRSDNREHNDAMSTSITPQRIGTTETDSSTYATTTKELSKESLELVGRSEASLQYAFQTLERALAYLDSIIKRALNLVQRLEILELAHEPEKPITTLSPEITERDPYAATKSMVMRDVRPKNDGSDASFNESSLLIPLAYHYLDD